MKTGNWQIKALTLFMVTVALCLTTACGTEYAGPERITPSAPCGDAAPLVPSVEFSRLSDNAGITVVGLAAMARAERLRPEEERIRVILDKYKDRIWRQNIIYGGSVHGWGVVSIRNEKDEITDKQVIEIDVTEYVDQRTLPPEDRIPECVEGIEVHFVVSPMARFE